MFMIRRKVIQTAVLPGTAFENFRRLDLSCLRAGKTEFHRITGINFGVQAIRIKSRMR